jgi:DNA repair exonuclease SbcCD ATPase subunit
MKRSKVTGIDRLSIAITTGFLIGALIFPGCGEKETAAPEKAEQALSQAQSNVERADELIAEMRRRSEELQQKIEQQRSALDGLIEKRLVLLRQQLTDYEQRLHRLPAAKENELKLTLADLKQRLDALAGKFQAYRDAPPEKSAAVLQELEAALKEFESSHQKFDAEIRPA